MDATFNCPDCGAPISFDPYPGDTTVECTYCGETVIIPLDLRIPMPPIVSSQPIPTPQPWRLSWVQAAGFSIVIIIAGVLAYQSANAPSENYDQVDLQVSTSIAEQSTTEAAQAQLDTEAQATRQAQDAIVASATAEALQPILKQEQSWQVLLTDKFNDTNSGWDSGDVRESNLNGQREINTGKYHWDVTSSASTFNSSFPNTADQTDILASVDIKYKSMPDDTSADAGLVLRYIDADQTWYYFSVNQVGQYYFGWHDGQEWRTLIPETDTAAFHPGEINRLSVGVQGSQFIFLINDQVIDSFHNTNLKTGKTGLGVNLPQAGENAVVDFSNFRLQAAPPAQ